MGATETLARYGATATAAGIPHTDKVDSIDDLVLAFRKALEIRELTTIVAKVDPVGPDSYFIDPHMLENRFEFQRFLAKNRD